MKIAVYHNLPSGGARRMLYELILRTAPHHQIDVYTLSSANHEFGDLRPVVRKHKIFPFSTSPMLKSPFGRLNQLLRLWDLIRLNWLNRQIAETIESQNYDLVFVNPCQFDNNSSLLLHLKKTPSMVICQEPLRRLYETMPPRPYDRPETGLRRLANKVDPFPRMYHSYLKRRDRQSIRRAGRVLVNSAYMQRGIKVIYGLDAHVVHPGVDAHFFQPLGLPREKSVVSVGSMTPLKGFDFIVRSLAKIDVSHRPPLVIASNFSNPPEKNYLAGLASSLQVDLYLQSGISDQMLLELYNRASLTVYSPHREPFGIVALESMACGTPVVAVREGGVRETVVHEKNGLLVDRFEDQFAQAVERLLEDPALAASYGQAARDDILQNWTWEKSAETFEAQLQAAVKK